MLRQLDLVLARRVLQRILNHEIPVVVHDQGYSDEEREGFTLNFVALDQLFEDGRDVLLAGVLNAFVNHIGGAFLH